MSIAAPSKNPLTTEGIQITGEGKYLSVPLTAIEIVERPTAGKESEVVFFNPRDLTSFTKEKMDALAFNIRTEGLQQPPIVRAITKGNKIVKVQLIAGERRIRSCRSIYEDNLPCFNEDSPRPKQYQEGETVIYNGRFGTVVEHVKEMVVVDFKADLINKAGRKFCEPSDVFPTISGSELYETISCRVLFNCSDERALRIAFSENDKSDPLTISEEISLVERLERMGKKQDEIAEMLGSNVTWVSQTSNFRRQLPQEAFEKLVKGNMARHIAVSLLSYAPEDRKALFEASMKAEQVETQQKIQEHLQLKERLEDEEDLLISDADQAEEEGDIQLAKKTRNKAASLAQKAEKEAEKLEKAKEDSGRIKQGHLKKGAAETGIMPKKAKPFDNDDIETVFVKGMIPYLEGEGIDEETGEKVPADLAAIVRRTALAILTRVRDPLYPIRTYMQENNKWEASEEECPIITLNKLKQPSPSMQFESAEDDEEFEDLLGGHSLMDEEE